MSTYSSRHQLEALELGGYGTSGSTDFPPFPSEGLDEAQEENEIDPLQSLATTSHLGD
jgi:hypothetical protein